MAEEASTGGAADNQPRSINQIYTKTTVTNLPTDYVEIGRPAPLWVPVQVAEEASTEDTMNEQCIYEVLGNNRTTDRKLSMNCSKYLSDRSREGSWNWPKRPGMHADICVEKKQCFFGGGSIIIGYRNDEADDRASLLDDGRRSMTVG